jgi:hypothetical protein
MYVLEIAEGPRTRGRKARGYVPIRHMDDIFRMMLEDALHINKPSAEGSEDFFTQNPSSGSDPFD